MQRRDATFTSGGDRIAAWVYPPDSPTSATGACVVMANGFSMTRHDGLEPYAERLTAAGATSVVFDHRYLGDSGGEPRQRFKQAEQLEDWRNAVTFARSLPAVNPDRVILWGFSFSGAHAVETAAADNRIAATLLLCPFLDGIGRIRATPLSLVAWILPRAVADLAGHHTTIPVTGPPGARAAMSLPGEAEGFAATVSAGSAWRNEISPGIFATVAFHRPWTKAARLTMPTWIALGRQDSSAPAAGIRKLAAAAPQAELHEYDVDHFQPLTPERQPAIANDQIDFLRRHHLLAYTTDGHPASR